MLVSLSTTAWLIRENCAPSYKQPCIYQLGVTAHMSTSTMALLLLAARSLVYSVGTGKGIVGAKTSPRDPLWLYATSLTAPEEPMPSSELLTIPTIIAEPFKLPPFSPKVHSGILGFIEHPSLYTAYGGLFFKIYTSHEDTENSTINR